MQKIIKFVYSSFPEFLSCGMICGHVKEYSLVSQTVYHCCDQHFVVNDLVPSVESEISGDDSCLLVGTQRDG